MPERSWFERHPLEVAFDLLGMEVVVDRDGTRTSGRIVEVEAYGGMTDPASHATFLKAGKLALFGEPGRLYMYRSYGIHTMLDFVAHQPGVAGAILIRALEPVVGIHAMQARRQTENPRLLTTGPGVLCKSMDLRLSDNGYDLVEGTEIQLRPGTSPDVIMAGPRIGISRAVDHSWRLFEAGSKFVSSHRRGEVVERSSLQFEIESFVEVR